MFPVINGNLLFLISAGYKMAGRKMGKQQYESCFPILFIGLPAFYLGSKPVGGSLG